MLERECEPESDEKVDNDEINLIREKLERASKNKDWREIIRVKKEIESKKPINMKLIDKADEYLRELSEERLRYLKMAEDYLKALIDKDRKAFLDLKKGVMEYLHRTHCDKKLIQACYEDCKRIENEKERIDCQLKCGCEIPTGEYLKCLGEMEVEHKRRQKALLEQLEVLRESKPYKYYKEFINLNDFEGYFRAVEEIKTKLNLPDPIPSPPKLPWIYSSPCPAGTTDSGAMTEKLVILLEQYIPNPPLIPNRTVVVKAKVSGGKPPYSYSWSGTPQGTGEEVVYQFSTAGEKTITVEVTDSLGVKETASIKIKVLEDLKAQIRGLSKEHIYGTEVMIQVEIPKELSEHTKSEPLSEECRPG